MKRYLWTLLIISSSILGFGQTKWLSIEGQDNLLKAPGHATPGVLKTLETRNEGLHLRFQLSGVLLDHSKGDGHTFTTLTLPGSGISETIGFPEVPVQRQFFLLPEGNAISFEVQNVETRSVHLPELGFSGWISPRQLPVPKIPGALEKAKFVWDQQHYFSGSKQFIVPATVKIIGQVRGYQLAMIEWFPVQSNPVTGNIDLLKSAEITIQFDNSFRNTNTDPFLSKWSMLLNKPKAPARAFGNYLILVADIFQSEIADLVTGKESQGFTVSTHVVAASTSATDIKSYISSLWGTSAAPAYILIIGDTDRIPAWTGGGEGTPNTDIQYACMDGADDWYPDIAIGRFPVDTSTQLGHLIEKTLFFEAGNFPRPEYVSEAVFMSSTDNFDITEGTHNYVIDNYFTPAGISSEKLYTVTYNATTQQVRDAFNDGRIFGIYSGHGGTTSWADGPPFSQSDVNNLTNDGLYAFVCSFACITGSYHIDECFTETWILAESKGACTIYGSSVNSYWTEDDILEKKLFEAFFVDNIREISPAWQEAMVKYLAHFGVSATTRRYFEMYNLMGDPSLAIPEPGGGTAMKVTPFRGFTAEGPFGGPFTPGTQVFGIENQSDTAFDFSATTTEPWLQCSPSIGTINPGAVLEVTVEINSQANSLDNGSYEADIQFVNTTNNDGDTNRSVDLIIGVPEVVHAFDLDEDPLWAMEGQWAYGQPTGAGGGTGNPDPTQGSTGDYVIGYNLNGDYANEMGVARVTSSAIDCTDLTRVSVRFQRWLGVESSSYDHADFYISTDATIWEPIFTNAGSMSDAAWTPVSYDISSFADGAPELYLRWTMGTTDGSVVYCGWNIDDIEIWGVLPEEQNPCPADIDGDGMMDMSDLKQIYTTWCNSQINLNGFCDIRILDLLDILEGLGTCPTETE